MKAKGKPRGKPFVKGGSGGPGRKPLPDWFRAGAEDAQRYMLAIVVGDEPCEPELRLKAAESLMDRVNGKAPRVPVPATPQERIAALEDVLAELGAGGDRASILAYLAARGGEEWRGQSAPQTLDTVDVVDFVPAITTSTPQP
jgi:hypothetical protein